LEVIRRGFLSRCSCFSWKKGFESPSVFLRAAVVIPSSPFSLQKKPDETEPMKSREQDPVIQSL
jgi:hypothetical protein